MSLPRVSSQIRQMVESRWLHVDSDDAVIDFIAEVKWELEQTNPVIVQVIDNLLSGYQGREFHTEVLIYVCSVCKMLQLSGGMVEVSYETAAPVQTEFLRDHNPYGQALIDRLSRDNPEIVNIARPLINRFQNSGHIRSASIILGCGLLLYKIVESQKEANELSDSLERFGRGS